MKIKNVTTFFVIYFLVSIVVHSHAQESPFKAGIKAGVNLSGTSIDTERGYDSMKKKVIPGYVLGATGEYAFTTHFSLASELLFLSKGFRLKGVDLWIPYGETRWTQTVNMHYVQLPVMPSVRFKIHDATDTRILLQAGPYVAYGLGGKAKIKNKYVDLSKENDSEKGSTFGSDGLRRFDCGLTFRLGVEFGKYTVAANFDCGLRNINPKDSELEYISDRRFKNRNGYITFGYSF